jgi:hypothetical protein
VENFENKVSNELLNDEDFFNKKSGIGNVKLNIDNWEIDENTLKKQEAYNKKA